MGRIQNFEQLAITPQRRAALRILESAYAAVDAGHLIRSKINLRGGELCLSETAFACRLAERIFFVGIGKGAQAAAEAMEEILGERLTAGIAIDLVSRPLKKIRSLTGTHPLPTAVNQAATTEVIKMLTGLRATDLVLVFVAGGGSALLCAPVHLTCEALADLIQSLTRAGANIQELNTVRKRLSSLAGGGLAKLAYPAPVVSFIVSDVPNNDLGLVASGPTVRDKTSVVEAEKILIRYNLTAELIETPKDEKYFSRVTNILLADAHTALEAMKKEAENLGWRADIIPDALTGAAQAVGKNLATCPIGSHSALLAAGETTVKVVNPNGRGGRNQDVALSALGHLSDERLVLAAASDGWDNSPATGALVDEDLKIKTRALELEPKKYLAENTSYDFFQATGGQIFTGRLASNVADLFLVLKN